MNREVSSAQGAIAKSPCHFVLHQVISKKCNTTLIFRDYFPSIAGQIDVTLLRTRIRAVDAPSNLSPFSGEIAHQLIA